MFSFGVVCLLAGLLVHLEGIYAVLECLRELMMMAVLGIQEGKSAIFRGQRKGGAPARYCTFLARNHWGFKLKESPLILVH